MLVEFCIKCNKSRDSVKISPQGKVCYTCKSNSKKEYAITNKEKASAYKKKYRDNNKDKINSKRIERVSKNREAYLSYHREYYIRNKEKLIKQQNEYVNKNREKSNSYKNKYYGDRLKNDHLYKLKFFLKRRTREFLKKRGVKYRGTSYSFIGIEYDLFLDYIKSKFKKGMTFENYGEWHIDHIIPLASAKTEEDVIRLCHYSNLQPLWAKDNIKKGSKIPLVQTKLAL